jgi:hypothetical protein
MKFDLFLFSIGFVSFFAIESLKWLTTSKFQNYKRTAFLSSHSHFQKTNCFINHVFFHLCCHDGWRCDVHRVPGSIGVPIAGAIRAIDAIGAIDPQMDMHAMLGSLLRGRTSSHALPTPHLSAVFG